ncbi:MAG: LysR family transcriptional regulator [Lachnospiraceae bacterium]|nr:LysR family transcriptional regulator [Lachnospiraceae bacterium]
MLDYRIETFLTLCECGSYHQAAEILHVTQPAITQQIHHLEAEYGCRLFRYANRKLEKTDAASLLETYARAVRQQEQSLREKLQKQSSVYSLRIGATKTIGDYVLTEHLHRFLDDPNHSLEFLVDNTDHLLRELEENRLDFAVIEGFFDKERFDSILFCREPFVGICHKDHPFAGKTISIEELLDETIIHREAGSGTRAILEQELMSYNESLSRFRHRICISSFKIILDLVREGYGISFVYNVLADSDPALGKFYLQGGQMMREFNIVYLKGTGQSEKIRCFFGETAF